MFIAVGLLAYKDSTLPLPGYALASEGVVLVMLVLTHLLRWDLARRGVSDKQAKFIVMYLVGSIFVLLSYIFELRLQTYVVLAEVITNWTGIGIVILEIISAIWVLKVLQHKKQSH
jgi:hypothetical protein